MFERILRVVFPPSCVGCNRYLADDEATWCALCACLVTTLNLTECCSRCGVPLKVLHHNPCASCRTRPPLFARAHGVLSFEGVLAQTVRGIKTNGRLANAQVLARWTKPMLDAELRPTQVCVPPAHGKSLKERGFHLPWMLASWWGLEPVDVLRRTRNAPRQAELDRWERVTSIRGAFSCDRQVSGDWLVVDDVMTTGATMGECARALRAAGAANVCGVALARVP